MSQKGLRRLFFLLAPAPNMLGTSQFPIGCMKWQHAVILESICETSSIIIFLPPNGRDSFFLFWLALFFSSFTWINYSKSKFLFSLLCLLGQNYPQSNSSYLFSSDKIILSPKSLFSLTLLDWTFWVQLQIPQKHSKTNSFSLLAANSLQFFKNILSFISFLTHEKFFSLLTYSKLLPLESKKCPLVPASVLACAHTVDELRFWSRSQSETVQPSRSSSKEIYLALHNGPSLTSSAPVVDSNSF